MVREIILNYDRLEEICYRILTFKTAIEELQAAMKVVKDQLDQNEGKAVEQLKEEHDELEKSVQIQLEELNDLNDIFSGYTVVMQGIMGALYLERDIVVDRDDVKANIRSIDNSVEDLDEELRRRLNPNIDWGIDIGLTDDERADEKHNERVSEMLEDEIARKIKSMRNLVEQLHAIHDNEIVPFENMDDEYQNKARDMYREVSSRSERWEARLEHAGEAIQNVAGGAVDALQGFVKETVSMAKGGVSLMIVRRLPASVEPEWATKCAKQARGQAAQGFKTVLTEPWVITEGLAQGVSDTIGNEGVAYVIGGAAPAAATAWYTKGNSVAVKAGSKVDHFVEFDDKADELKGMGSSTATSALDEFKTLIKNGEVKGNNIICKVDDNTQIIFRKDTGDDAHPIKPKYPDATDHYNVEIQKKTSAGKWKSKASFHIVIDENGNIIDKF